jgi:peptide/nickel transport system substrate-binding protein
MLAGCAPTAEGEQTLVLSQISDPDSFNAYLSTDQATRQIISYTLCGLTTLDEDTLQPKPELADWEVLDDGLRYIFTLRPQLYWSDGEPLTAADVDFTFNRIIFNEQIPTSSRDVQRIGEAQTLPQVRMLNETQVEFTLPEPFAPFLIQAGSPIMPRHLLEPTIEDTDAEGQPRFLQTWGINTPVDQLISCGPYIIDAYIPNQRVLYRTNPYYWQQGEDGATLPRIPQAVRTIIDSQDTELIKFRSGELDAYTVRGVDFRLLKREEDQRAFTLYNLGPTLNNNFITLNQSQARNPDTGEPFVDPVKGQWFRSLSFRRALAHAIDKQGLVDSVLQGLGQPQDYTISPASPFHLPPGEGVPVYEYNPDKARELLLQAGFTYREDGRLLDAEGNLVRFTLNTNAGNNEREATGSLIKAYLDEIGITLDFVPIAFNSLVEKISQTRDWDAVMLSFGGGGVEPNNGANVWRSTGRLHLWNLGTQPGSEVEGWVVTAWEQEIDRIFSEGTRILDFEERKALYDRFQVIAQEQLPLINTYNPLELVALRDRLQGVDPRPILGSLWNYEELYIED